MEHGGLGCSNTGTTLIKSSGSAELIGKSAAKSYLYFSSTYKLFLPRGLDIALMGGCNGAEFPERRAEKKGATGSCSPRPR
jgi:hypothetical protein